MPHLFCYYLWDVHRTSLLLSLIKKAEQLKPYSTELVREMFIKKEIVNLDVTSWDASKSTGFQRCFPTNKSVCRKFIELQKEKERLSS